MQEFIKGRELFLLQVGNLMVTAPTPTNIHVTIVANK